MVKSSTNKAFSLVEITVAVGIVSFALLAIMGLIPVGLKSVQDSSEQTRATDILNLAASGIQGQYYLGTNGGQNNYAFANYVSDNDPATVAGDTNPPWSAHTKYYVTQQPFTINFNVLEDLSIRKKSDTTTTPRYQLYMKVTPSADSISPVKVYLSVAWPGVASYGTNGWSKQQGYVETTVYANTPPPR